MLAKLADQAGNGSKHVRPLFKAALPALLLGAAASVPLVSTPTAAHAAPAPMTAVSNIASGQAVSFDVLLPLRDKAGLDTLLTQLHDEHSAQYHQWLTPAAFAQRFGPDQATLDKAAASFRAQGLTAEIRGRSIHVAGTAAAVGHGLSTSLAVGTLPSGKRHLFAAARPVMPDAVAQAGGILIGFRANPHVAHTMVRRVTGALNVDNRKSTTGGYWYNDLKQAYRYPSYQSFVTVHGKKQRLDGTGTTVALLMSSDVLDSDIAALFNHENFARNSGKGSNPTLFKRVYVNGAVPGDISGGAFDEASLDTQEAITGAPGAHVVLYDIPDLSDDNIEAGYLQIIQDNQADVVSSSFGGCELAYTAAYNSGTDYTSILQAEHELFEQGNAQGITFLASSGDEAGLECPTVGYAVNGTAGTFIPSVSVPAADPNVTAVGGTNVLTKHTAGSLDSTYTGENAYSDPEIPYDIYGLGANVSGGVWGAGGGVSTLFRKPLYQYLANSGSSKMRTIPDIGMQVGGCPGGISVLPCNGGDNPLNGNGNTDRSYVIVALDGAFYGLIGTSVASPELAGATALLVERYGRVGNLNSLIYAYGGVQTLAGNAFGGLFATYHRDIPGYNGVVTNNQPGHGFDFTVGNGTPIVNKFVGAADMPVAGLPQTASNP